MSTDHHLEDNADDHARVQEGIARSPEAGRRELEHQLGGPIPDTPPHIRGRHFGTSAITGSFAGRDIHEGEVLIDLVGPPFVSAAVEPDRREPVARLVGARIFMGQRLEVGEDGKIYPADETAEDLAEQLVALAETAAAADEVDQAIGDAAGPSPDYDFAEAIAGMANRHLRSAGLALEVVEACSGCGCTNRRACVTDHPRSIGGGMFVRTCHWIATAPGQPPRCSKCGPTEEALEKDPATIMGIRIHRDDTVPAGELQLRDDAGRILIRVTNIEQPTDRDVDELTTWLVRDEPLTPYAAAETMTAEREDDEQPDPLEETARRRP